MVFRNFTDFVFELPFGLLALSILGMAMGSFFVVLLIERIDRRRNNKGSK